MTSTQMTTLALLLLATGCGTAEKTGDKTQTVNHPSQQKTFGGDRPVTIDVPANYDKNTPTPLIVLLHGYSAGGFVQKAYFGFDLLVDEAGVIVVAPDGTVDSGGNRFWNATDYCCNFNGSTVDDVAYIAKLITDISAEWNIDPKRVYVTGHSNGGFMSYRMACEHPELIAGIMALAGDTWADAAKCHPSEPVSVLDIQGDADRTIEHDGEPGYPGARESVGMWAGYDGCSGTLVSSGADLDLESALAGAETTTEHNSVCPAGIDVALWTVRGGSHLPTFNDSFRARMWDWLAAHPKP